MLKNSGDALRAFIGAGFCAVILSLSACASKGAADIPIGGIINVGGGGGGETPRELVNLPPNVDTTTLDHLDTLADFTRLNAAAIRDGGDGDPPDPASANPFRPIIGRQYDFTDGSIIVQQLQYAYLGVWIADDIDENNIVDNGLRYENLADNIPTTSPTTLTPTATYNLEGDALFNGLRFYPDGELTADFGAGTLSGELSARGDDTNRDDDFGVGATLPNGGRALDAGDILVLLLTDVSFSVGGEFSVTFSNNPTTRGFFASLDLGGGPFNGRFHDADTYDGTAAPTELSGTFQYDGGTGDSVSGGFLGELQP